MKSDEFIDEAWIKDKALPWAKRAAVSGLKGAAGWAARRGWAGNLAQRRAAASHYEAGVKKLFVDEFLEKFQVYFNRYKNSIILESIFENFDSFNSILERKIISEAITPTISAKDFVLNYIHRLAVRAQFTIAPEEEAGIEDLAEQFEQALRVNPNTLPVKIVEEIAEWWYEVSRAQQRDRYGQVITDKDQALGIQSRATAASSTASSISGSPTQAQWDRIKTYWTSRGKTVSLTNPYILNVKGTGRDFAFVISDGKWFDITDPSNPMEANTADYDVLNDEFLKQWVMP